MRKYLNSIRVGYLWFQNVGRVAQSEQFDGDSYRLLKYCRRWDPGSDSQMPASGCLCIKM
jgi:hypothetical protein